MNRSCVLRRCRCTATAPGTVAHRGLNDSFFLKITPTKQKNNPQTPTILGILRVKKAWKTSKHLFLFSFNSWPLRLPFRFSLRWFVLFSQRDDLVSFRAKALRPSVWSADLPLATFSTSPAPNCSPNYCQRLQYQSNFVKPMGGQNIELKTVPKALIKYYSTGLRYVFIQ